MAIPVAFLLGLLVVMGHRELVQPVPGEATVEAVAAAAALLVVPLLLAAAALAQARRALTSARRPVVPGQALLRLSAAATPIVLHALFEFGSYGDCIDRLAPDSHLLRILLTMLPLYLAELPRVAIATAAEAMLEVDLASRNPRPIAAAMLPGILDVWPQIRLRFGWPLLLLLPAFLLGAGLDLLQLNRTAYVVVLATSFGTAVGAVVFLLVTAIVLPFWFRIAFGTRSDLPEPLGVTLRMTAHSMGFSSRRILLLPTGGRAMNAMMVGPLPIGRLLCLTDGLVATLDSRSLCGVLAHEIGHARMGHPGILMSLALVLPMLLLAPLRWFDIERVDPVWQSVGVVLVALVMWLAVRALARRFEHEADAASVRALGAEPCSRALLLVSQWAAPVVRGLPGRLFSMHPDEHQRLSLMRSYEQDLGFREQFDRRGRQLRGSMLALVAVALAIAGWTWFVDWQYERVLVQFHTGDFVAARRSLSSAEDAPARFDETFARIDEELAVGLELAPGARDWPMVQLRLDPAAWQRGEEVLLANGPAAARPWFALAIEVMQSPSSMQMAIGDYCDAAAAGDAERVERLGRVIHRNGAPATLERVFAGYR